MFSIVIPELIILLIILILLFGPDRIGKGIRGFRASLRGKNQSTVQQETVKDKKQKSN